MNIMLDLRKNICLYDFLQRLRRCKICIIFTMDVTMAIGIGCLRHHFKIESFTYLTGSAFRLLKARSTSTGENGTGPLASSGIL